VSAVIDIDFNSAGLAIIAILFAVALTLLDRRP